MLAIATFAAALVVALLGLAVWRIYVRAQRRLLGVLLEQVRREGLSRVKYRPDQRLRACQQRLARFIGPKRAFGRRWTERIRAALEAGR